MRIEWIAENRSRVVVVFFNGWGMNAHAVSHLEKDCDVVMIYDYRDLECTELSSLQDYEKVYVVAWSMGVWAAANTLPKLGIKTDYCIAVNGTERPVDDEAGISLQAYCLTENGMDERGRAKFFMRMLAGKEELMRFEEQKPDRELAEQLEELKAIRKQSETCCNTIKWDRGLIAEKDVIFPTSNQLNWWSGKTTVHMLPGGHYPFYNFQSWEELIDFEVS